jgi:protein-S-isoprenylcysteine O-methyltransferase Ste14
VNAPHVANRAFAWSGALLFAAALAYFLFSYSVTFGEITAETPGDSALREIAIDIALFSAFALHHSIFARIPVRAAIRRIVPAQLERSVYVWVASLMLIGTCYWWQAVPGVAWHIPRPWSWAMLPVQVAGIWLTLRSAAVIDGLELAGVRQMINPKSQNPNPKSQNAVDETMEFKTEGPYGWVRHPIYLGWILVVFCVGTMSMTRFVFAAISSVYLLIAIPFEERTIRAQSAGAYDDYIRRVPRKLIPGIY